METTLIKSRKEWYHSIANSQQVILRKNTRDHGSSIQEEYGEITIFHGLVEEGLVTT